LAKPARSFWPRGVPHSGAKNQHAQPGAARVGEGVKKLLAHGADVAQVMMPGQPSPGAGFGLGSWEQMDLDSGQSEGTGVCRGARRLTHARSLKNFGGKVRQHPSTHALSITCRRK
jgi:hypothetical protein